jgi:single-stranded-DNA-specific exonuclease
MNAKRWILRKCGTEETQSLAHDLSISPITAAILIGRGRGKMEDARSWIGADGTSSHDPFLLPDMERVVDRIYRALNDGERIGFYGDYDVDGIAATSIHLNYFGQYSSNLRSYIPQRLTEGYGLNEEAIHTLKKDGVSVLVTSDCGTSSFKEIEVARDLGVDVIVIDHHQIPEAPPRPFAFLNPYRADSRYPFRDLCSGGLAYKVAEAYSVKFGEGSISAHSLKDLATLATIADIVPLLDENRDLVRAGLIHLTESTRCGIRGLKQVLGIDGPCLASTVGFRLAPVINAAGRLADAQLGVDLLTTDSEEVACQLAKRLQALNLERRHMEQETVSDAQEGIGPNFDGSAVVVGSKSWHAGVVGIVAARLVERYHRPAVVVAFNAEGLGRGSVRSIPGFDVCQALAGCQDVLEGFGGHAAAAGLTVREDMFPLFQEKFRETVLKLKGGHVSLPELNIDTQVNLSDIHLKLIREFELLEPFGMGNVEPTLLVANLRILEHRIVGGDHLKLVVRQQHSVPFEAIGFRMANLASHLPGGSQCVDLACVPELNQWKGYSRVQLRVRDMRLSSLVGGN